MTRSVALAEKGGRCQVLIVDVACGDGEEVVEVDTDEKMHVTEKQSKCALDALNVTILTPIQI